MSKLYIVLDKETNKQVYSYISKRPKIIQEFSDTKFIHWNAPECIPPECYVVFWNYITEKVEYNYNIEIEIQRLMADMRNRRNTLLRETDYHMLQDVFKTYSKEKQAKIVAYREALRDLPQTITDPRNIIWPVLEI